MLAVDIKSYPQLYVYGEVAHGAELHYVNALQLLKLHSDCSTIVLGLILALYCIYKVTLKQPTPVSAQLWNLPLFFLVGDRWFHISERPPHLYQVSAGKTAVWAREKDGTITSSQTILRTVPTFVNAHMFCASRKH